MTSNGLVRKSLALAGVLLGLCQPASAEAGQCFLPNCLAAAGLSQWATARTTGHPGLDARLREEASLLAQTFGVDPQVFLFDDGQWPNAYARPGNHPPFRDTIFMGHRLLQQTVAVEQLGDIGIVLVMAHEWAHILQGSAGLPDNLELRHRELHADVLAGWYLARRNLAPSSHVRNVASLTFGRLPQARFSSRSHGTPDARMAAMMLGYARSDWPLGQIYDFGLQFVLRHF